MPDDAGPLLVRAGLIANHQLVAARQSLTAQGGTIGEHLVAAGYLDDEALTAFYRKRLMVPRIDPHKLKVIPAAIIERIPADMAAEFRVVPVTLDGDANLVVAMSDPSNSHAVDEVGFFTGAYVVRAIAQQSEIATALHHYYGIQTALVGSGAASADAELAQAADSAADPQLAAHSERVSERRRVLPPMTSPPPSDAPAVRISEIAPELGDSPAPPATLTAGPTPAAPAPPPTASPTSPTLVEQPASSNRGRSAPSESKPPPTRADEAEADTRPIMTVAEMELALQRRAEQAAQSVSGEVESRTTHARRLTAESLPAVILSEDQLTPPPPEPSAAADPPPASVPDEPTPDDGVPKPVEDTRSEPILLERAKSRPEPVQEGADDVILLERPKARRRISKPTNVGVGSVGSPSQTQTAVAPPGAGQPKGELPGAQPAAQGAAARGQRKEAAAEDGAPVARASTDHGETTPYERPRSARPPTPDDWGEPGSTIPPAYLGATPDSFDRTSPLGIPLTDLEGNTTPTHLTSTQPNNQPAGDDARPRSPSAQAELDLAHASSGQRLAETTQTLRKTTARDQVIDAIVGHLRPCSVHVIFFAVHSGALRVWSTAGCPDVPEADAIQVPLHRPSTFHDIVATRLPFRGPLNDSLSRDLIITLTGCAPAEAIALPVTLRGKVVGILYADGCRPPIFSDHLNSLTREAGLALERALTAQKASNSQE